MSIKRALPAWTLALSAVLALGVLGLAGCSSRSGSSADEKQEAVVNDDKAAGSASADGGVWVIVKETTTYKEGEYEPSFVATYELDEHGNTLKVTQDSDDDEPYVTEYEFDEDGFVTKYVTTGVESATVTNALEKDDQGREVKCTSDDGSTVETTYDADGHVKSRVFCSPSETMDEEGNWEVVGSYTTTVNFGTDGFVTDGATVVSDLGNDSYSYGYTKTYERDADGNVTGVTTTTFQRDENGNPIEGSANTTSSKLEFDENGNLVRSTEESESYTTVTEYEYVKVEDPSLYVRLESYLKYV